MAEADELLTRRGGGGLLVSVQTARPVVSVQTARPVVSVQTARPAGACRSAAGPGIPVLSSGRDVILSEDT
jgi:hypothetical protein